MKYLFYTVLIAAVVVLCAMCVKSCKKLDSISATNDSLKRANDSVVAANAATRAYSLSIMQEYQSYRQVAGDSIVKLNAKYSAAKAKLSTLAVAKDILERSAIYAKSIGDSAMQHNIDSLQNIYLVAQDNISLLTASAEAKDDIQQDRLNKCELTLNSIDSTNHVLSAQFDSSQAIIKEKDKALDAAIKAGKPKVVLRILESVGALLIGLAAGSHVR